MKKIAKIMCCLALMIVPNVSAMAEAGFVGGAIVGVGFGTAVEDVTFKGKHVHLKEYQKAILGTITGIGCGVLGLDAGFFAEKVLQASSTCITESISSNCAISRNVVIGGASLVVLAAFIAGASEHAFAHNND